MHRHLQEIEIAAGRLGHEEEALHAKTRDIALPDDFPAPTLPTGARKKRGGSLAALEDGALMADLKWGEAVFGASLLDDDELSAILAGDDPADAAEFGLSGSLSGMDFPVTADGGLGL